MSAMFVGLALLCALLMVYGLGRAYGWPQTGGRFASIDGLRGYLAFFVFLHHSAVWYPYIHNGQWVAPNSHLFNHLGQSSVVLFFMITAFLFSRKIFQAKHQPIDWTRLYVSRCLRLFPLYLFALVILLLVVFCLTDFVLQVPLPLFLKQVMLWAGFTMFGIPDLNGVEHTWILFAGVTWSLAYEWFFYLLLPVFAWLLGRQVPITYKVFGGLAVGFVAWRRPELIHMLSFSGGVIAAWIVQQERLRQHLCAPIFGAVALACIVVLVGYFDSAYGLPQFTLLSVTFAIFASGNTLFGVLTHRVSRLLGDMSYSIYLLHGLLLFIVFKLLLGTSTAVLLSPLQYGLLICICAAVLMGVCLVTFRWIEAPAMKQVDGVTQRVRALYTPLMLRLEARLRV